MLELINFKGTMNGKQTWVSIISFIWVPAISMILFKYGVDNFSEEEVKYSAPMVIGWLLLVYVFIAFESTLMKVCRSFFQEQAIIGGKLSVNDGSTLFIYFLSLGVMLAITGVWSELLESLI